MKGIFVVGLLSILSSVGYLVFQFAKKTKDKDITVSKKIFYSLLIGGTALALIGTTSNNSQLSAQVLNLEQENEMLEERIRDLSEKTEEIKSEYHKAITEVEELEMDVSNLKKEVDKLVKESESLADDNIKLKKEIDSLTKEVEQAKEKLETKAKKEQEKSVVKKETSRQTQTQTETAASTNSKVNTLEQNTSTNTAEKATEAKEDCKIKGTSSGIYHVPGSTYYNRTKNVAQWFCSVEEAENAGYRAPKR